jgi:hypothetical protein
MAAIAVVAEWPLLLHRRVAYRALVYGFLLGCVSISTNSGERQMHCDSCPSKALTVTFKGARVQ